MKLSLVSCAVGLYPATTSSARTSFHTINRDTGNRVKRQFIDSETGDVVETEDQVKGYEVGKGSYVIVDPEELDAIKIESTHTINIERFVPRDEVDERYLDVPYYLAPEDKVAQEAFAVIRDAMKAKDKAGVARIVLANRERIVLLEPHGKGVLATILRYPYEVKPDEAFFEELPDVELPKEMSELAAHIIDKKAGKFDPTEFEDRYEEAVLALVKSKQNGKDPKPIKEGRKASNVINLMDALKKSIAAEGKGGKSDDEGEGDENTAPVKRTRKASGSAASSRSTKKTATTAKVKAGAAKTAASRATSKKSHAPLKKAS